MLSHIHAYRPLLREAYLCICSLPDILEGFGERAGMTAGGAARLEEQALHPLRALPLNLNANPDPTAVPSRCTAGTILLRASSDP